MLTLAQQTEIATYTFPEKVTLQRNGNPHQWLIILKYLSSPSCNPWTSLLHGTWWPRNKPSKQHGTTPWTLKGHLTIIKIMQTFYRNVFFERSKWKGGNGKKKILMLSLNYNGLRMRNPQNGNKRLLGVPGAYLHLSLPPLPSQVCTS